MKSNNTYEARVERNRARREAEALRKKADALKALAEYAQDYNDDGYAVAEAWDTYQEATNAAARAEKQADEAQAAYAQASWTDAIKEAAAVKVRDYLLIDDIPVQATNIPADLTFGDLMEAAVTEPRPTDDTTTSRVVAERIGEKYNLDTEPTEKLVNRIEWLLECADDEEVPESAWRK